MNQMLSVLVVQREAAEMWKLLHFVLGSEGEAWWVPSCFRIQSVFCVWRLSDLCELWLLCFQNGELLLITSR